MAALKAVRNPTTALIIFGDDQADFLFLLSSMSDLSASRSVFVARKGKMDSIFDSSCAKDTVNLFSDFSISVAIGLHDLPSLSAQAH